MMGARFAVLAVALTPGAALAATANSSARATTVRPLSVVRTADLEFGSLVPSAIAGSATIDAVTDVRTTGGGVVGASGAMPSAAHFTASGEANRVAIVALPGSVVLTRVAGSETMTVNAITSNGPTVRTFSNAGILDIAVGGTLGVAANQAAGAYVGTFTLMVFYL